MDLFSVKGGQVQLLASLFPAVKRDVYLEKWLDPGDYLVVPKSTKLNDMNKNPFQESSNQDINAKSPIFKSILMDLFQKFDYSEEQRLSLENLQSLFKVIDPSMDKKKFNKISLQYGNLEKSNEGYLTESGFIKYLSNFFLTKNREQIINDFE